MTAAESAPTGWKALQHKDRGGKEIGIAPLISISQFTPVLPGRHAQWYVFAATGNVAKQSAPFWQGCEVHSSTSTHAFSADV